jgi:hypothetical protein
MIDLNAYRLVGHQALECCPFFKVTFCELKDKFSCFVGHYMKIMIQ